MFDIVVKNPNEAGPMEETIGSIQLKRQVVVKTLVTDMFRQRAKSELTEEHKMLEAQLQQFEAQYQHTINKLEDLAAKGQNVQQQLDQVDRDYQRKRTQLSAVKMQVSTQLANLDKISNGQYIVTGQLEDTVELKIGDNLYQKMQNAEMIVEDGVIKAIRPLQG